MGTSGAFGGSDTKKWMKVRLTLGQALEAGTPGAGGDDAPGVEEVMSEVAEALIGDDPSVRPGRRISNPTPSSTVENLLGHLGRGGRTGRRGAAGGGGGRRSIGSSARGGGRAVYAAYAAASGNASALATVGVDFADLRGRDWYEQVLVIVDTVIGTSSNADEHALRSAVVEILLTMEEPTTLGDPVEALRDVIAAYVCELAVVELTAALTAEEITEAEAAAFEHEVRAYVDVRRDGIDLPVGAVHTVTDFEDAAELLTQEVLLILRAGGATT